MIETILVPGYDRLCGFQSLDLVQKLGPFASWDAPIPLRYTGGSSNYSLRTGLRINKDERIIDFFNDFLEYSAKKAKGESLVKVTGLGKYEEYHDSHTIGDGLLVTSGGIVAGRQAIIQFHRRVQNTLDRANDCHGSIPALADAETLNVYNVSDFKTKLPLQMRKKGGYLVPMFQREIIELSFRSPPGKRVWEPEEFALKVYAGSINVVSGKETSDHTSANDSTQDFIVIPAQRLLKGVNINADTAQWFMVMPLTWGYTLEKQVVGDELIGGIQFEIAPKLNNRFRVMLVSEWGESKNSTRGLDISEKLTLSHGDTFLLQILCTRVTKQLGENLYEPRFGYLKHKPDRYESTRSFVNPSYRASFIHELESFNAGSVNHGLPFEPDYSNTDTPLVILALDAIPISLISEPYIYTKYGPVIISEPRLFSPFLDLKDFVDTLTRSPFSVHLKLVDDSNVGGRHMIFANGIDVTRQWKARGHKYTPISSILPVGGTITITSPLETQKTRMTLAGKLRTAIYGSRRLRARGWEMGLGAQGYTQQTIRQSLDKRVWRWDKALFFNVQIINAVMFQEITGLDMRPVQRERDTKLQEIGSGVAVVAELPQPLGASDRECTRPPQQLKRAVKSIMTATPVYPLEPTTPSPFLTVSEIDRSKTIATGVRFKKGVAQLACACCEMRFCTTM
ncbi:hypothetical protein TWF281_007588 [Arthrobotrys megalospora]